MSGLRVDVSEREGAGPAVIVATWNVNSIRARLERAVAWLGKARPDVVCLQELKVVDELFPADVLAEAGYHSAVLGQKTYNGVAVLSRTAPDETVRGLSDGVDDPQARLVGCRFGPAWVYSVYVPNGGAIGTEKFTYKLDWLARLRAMLADRHDPADEVLVCGDFNVAPGDGDVANPADWADSVLCVDEVRRAFGELVDWGLVDVFRQAHPEGGVYSWWDYRNLGFPRNDGLRLDHILATASLAGRCSAVEVDRDERKGKKPSDHAPVVGWFE